MTAVRRKLTIVRTMLLTALLTALLASLLSACSTLPKQAAAPAPAVHAAGASLRYIGEQRLPLRMPFMGTTVGGLSGIDYDRASDTWIMESDDRSERNPARFYTAKLRFDQAAFHAVTLTGVHFWRQPDGSLYPGAKAWQQAGGEVPDVETVRYDPLDASIWYASEGDRKLGMQPFVRQARADGGWLSTLPTPALLRVWPQREYGVRNNQAFEGLSFAPDGRTLWLAMESPLYQDGALPTPAAGAIARITHLRRDGSVLGQYAYPLDPIPHAPAAGKFADNGVSEILAVDGQHLYAIERAGVQDSAGMFRFHIRLYEMDVSGATDVQALEALQDARYTPARKRLVLNLGTLPLSQLDNIEGMAFGPKLANGHDSLVLVSDDNFNDSEVTQLLLFEVVPR